MNRVMFNRRDFPHHIKVRTVIIQSRTFCDDCPGRIECLSIDPSLTQCHLKVEWYVPRDRSPQQILVWRCLLVPCGTLWGEVVWSRNNNKGLPIESYIQHLDDNWKRLTGLTAEEFEAKLKV